MKKLLFITLAVVLSVCLVMPVSAKKARVLKFSSIHEPTHVSAITTDVFADRVDQLTNGELDVQAYHSRQLGDALQNVENIRNGSIAFTSVSIANLSPVIPAMDMFSLPYIFKNANHYCADNKSQHATDDKTNKTPHSGAKRCLGFLVDQKFQYERSDKCADDKTDNPDTRQQQTGNHAYKRPDNTGV